MNPKLEQLMQEKGLTADTILYRYTYQEFLTPKGDNKFDLSANENATEIVLDVYNLGLREVAHDFGKGLTFLRQKEAEFELPEKVCVQVKLGAILSQGGLIYPDNSSFVEGAFYLTMPAGHVEVEMAPNNE